MRLTRYFIPGYNWQGEPPHLPEEEKRVVLTCAPSPRLVAAGRADASLDSPVATNTSPSASVSWRWSRRSSSAYTATSSSTRSNCTQRQGRPASGPFAVQLEEELQGKESLELISILTSYIEKSPLIFTSAELNTLLHKTIEVSCPVINSNQ